MNLWPFHFKKTGNYLYTIDNSIYYRKNIETTPVINGIEAMKTGQIGLSTPRPSTSLSKVCLELKDSNSGVGRRAALTATAISHQPWNQTANTSTFQSNCQASEAQYKRPGFQGCLRPRVTLIVESHTNGSGALVQTTHFKHTQFVEYFFCFVCNENGLLQFNKDGCLLRITILGEICFL